MYTILQVHLPFIGYCLTGLVSSQVYLCTQYILCLTSILHCFAATCVCCACETGSGQQSVTGVTAVEDSNSYWSVRGPSDALCYRGTPVKCGQTIRLTHVNTGRNLHSHYFASPLSSNQVCCVEAHIESGEELILKQIILAFKINSNLHCYSVTLQMTYLSLFE